MWIWRGMEKVSWIDKKANEEVLKIVGEERNLIQHIINRKKTWIGHALRGESLIKDVHEKNRRKEIQRKEADWNV